MPLQDVMEYFVVTKAAFLIALDVHGMHQGGI